LLNQDVERLHLGPPAIDHVHDFNAISESAHEQEEDDNPLEDDDDVNVEIPEVNLRNPLLSSPKKRGRLKGSKNKTYKAIPRTTRTHRGHDVPLVPRANLVNKEDLDDEDITNKGDSYYLAFLAGSQTLEDLTTLEQAL
jgi:hypothetical protein